MAITKEKKKEILQDLVEKFSKSKTVVFSDYRGLDVSSISDLRGKLRETGSECKVAKKTLIKLAAKEQNLDDLGADIMEGPVAVTFSYEDELSGLKALFKFSKENENLKLLGGIIDGKVVGADEIIQLAKLPSKEELYAKMLGSLNAPISGFVGIMGNLLGGFVRVVNAYKDSLPAEAIETEEKPEKTEDTANEPDDAVGTEASTEQGRSDLPSTDDEVVQPAEPTEEPKEEKSAESDEPVVEEAPTEAEEKAEETPAESTEPVEGAEETEAPKEEKPADESIESEEAPAEGSEPAESAEPEAEEGGEEKKEGDA